MKSLRGSKYGLTVMKDEEALLFVEVCMENGSDAEEALKDMRFIDNLLCIDRIHLLSYPHVSKTRRGYYRKGQLLSDMVNSVVDARVND